MKLAVCAQGEGLKAKVDERFGRCPCFVIVDTENADRVITVNNSDADASGGAGPQAAQLLAGLGVSAVALGNVGPNAATALEAAKIAVYSGITGTVEETLQKYRAGDLHPVSEASVPPHSGMKGMR